MSGASCCCRGSPRRCAARLLSRRRRLRAAPCPQPYKKKEDADGTGGIIVPLNPLGMRMYDEGERFDLRSPYSGGWARRGAGLG
jgi:hypothetical protein